MSFLSSRSHKVRLGAQTSATYNILFGVPQGSILGPLLFILYTTNIVNIASNYDILIHMYADDTQLYINLVTKDICSLPKINW
jgi:mannose/fructose/N-acetylgalactosamine-specific phosphotransferase system component IID